MGYAKKKSVVNPAATAADGPRSAGSVASVGASKSSRSTSIWNMQIGGSKQKTDMKRVEVLLFVSELADLLEAGMTLGQALQALSNHLCGQTRLEVLKALNLIFCNTQASLCLRLDHLQFAFVLDLHLLLTE